jgi:hypothetical protein
LLRVRASISGEPADVGIRRRTAIAAEMPRAAVSRKNIQKPKPLSAKEIARRSSAG